MIRIVIADDESLVASALATLLNLEADLDVVAVLQSGHDVVQWLTHTAEPRADVLVCDLHLGDADGIDTARAVRDAHRHVPTLIVTSHAKPVALKRALKAGIEGFLPKASTAEEFAAAVRAVHSGKRYLDPELAALAIEAQDSPLTERESELLVLAGRGYSVDEIASRAFLAAGTCRNYLSSAMQKTGASNRFEAYTVALERGWI